MNHWVPNNKLNQVQIWRKLYAWQLVKMPCIVISARTTLDIYLYIHRNIALESALVMDPALARPSKRTKEEKSLTSSLILPTPPFGDSLNPEGHWNGDFQITYCARGCGDFALSNKKKEWTLSRGGGGKQGVETRRRYGMWTSLLICPLKIRRLKSVVIILSPWRKQLSSNARVRSGWYVKITQNLYMW